MGYFSILILLLLLAAAVSGVLVYFRPHLAAPALFATAAVLLLLWLPARLQLPATPVMRLSAIGSLPSWSWQMSEEEWWLGLSFILLIIGGTLLTWVRRPSSELSLPALILALFLLGTALLAVGADSLATLLATWFLLDGIWLSLLILPPLRTAERAAAWGHFFFPVATLFLLWLAALTLPEVTGATGLNVRSWPVLTRSLLLLAALVQIGTFPFHFWRPLSRRFSPLLAVLAHTAPIAAGAALLVRIEAASDIALAFALPLTLLALLGLLWSANAAWHHSDDRLRIAALLGVGQASLVLLAGTWVGPEATLAEARVLLLAGAIFLLSAQAKDTDLLGKLGPLLALMAFAGLPLTAGFTGRTAVYDIWLAGGRWLLILVTALLHVPFIAAALFLIWEGSLPTLRRPQSWPTLATAAGLLLPALGLFAFAGLGDASLVAWLALLLPVAAAALLVYFLEQTDAVREMVREALSIPVDTRRFLAPVVEAGRALPLALREALAILEGEYGLMWLFLILLLIWFVRAQI